MKALKERRTSLRSLVRRGLVILSLFALVFAVSCGGSEGSSSSPGEGGEDLPATTRKVVEMKVLASPSIYSFQGMAPDLTGLVVEVKWSDGTTYEQITDTTQFYTIPTTLEKAGTTPAQIGDVWLFHNSNKELPAVVAIPRVVAINNVDITGKGPANETIYEDEGVNTTGMTLNARYAKIAEQRVTGHTLTGGTYSWDAVDTEMVKQLPVYSDVNRWDFKTGAASKIAYYKVVSTGVADDTAMAAPFQFDNYYYVDKIVVNNKGTFDKFAADDLVYVNPATNGFSPEQTQAAAAAWLDLLEDAGVTFDVTYYGDPNPPKTKTMADYKRAYSMTDLAGAVSRKASYPVLSYDTFAAALTEGIGINVFLQYYDKEINSSTGAPENTEPKPNQMMVNFPPTSILEYTGVAVERKPNTGTYNPEVIAQTGLEQDLKEALGTYYDVYRVYSNTAGDEVRMKEPFGTIDKTLPTWTFSGGWSTWLGDPAFTSDNTGNADILPNNPYVMLVPNPPSLGAGSDFDYTFMYDIHPPRT